MTIWLYQKLIKLGTLIIALFGVYALPASAQLLFNPAEKAELGQMEGAAGIGFSEVTYENDGETDVDRKFISGYGAYGVNDKIDVVVAGAFSFETEAEDLDDDGTGFILGGGVRSTLPFGKELPLQLQGYGQLIYVDEDYGDLFGAEVEATGLELSLGVAAIYDEIEKIRLYGALELVPYSDFEAESRGVDEDFDRDDMIGIRLGGRYDMDPLFIDLGLGLIHEQTFIASIGKTF